MLNNRTQAPSCSKEMPSLSTLEDLWLKEKSMNVLKEGITIVDCNQPDFPIIYANEGFVRTAENSSSQGSWIDVLLERDFWSSEGLLGGNIHMTAEGALDFFSLSEEPNGWNAIARRALRWATATTLD